MPVIDVELVPLSAYDELVAIVAVADNASLAGGGMTSDQHDRRRPRRTAARASCACPASS